MNYTTKKYLSWTAILIFFSILIGILLPYSIGKIIKITLPQKIAAFNQQPLSSLNIKCRDIKTGVYHSTAELEIDLLLNSGKSISFKAIETIQHGPIILDFQNKQLHFKLAKIQSQIQFLNSDKIKYDPEQINLSAFLGYGGTIQLDDQLPDLSLHFKIDITKDSLFQIKLAGLQLKVNLGLFTQSGHYSLKVKQLAYFDNKNIFRFDINGLHTQTDFRLSDLKQNSHSLIDNFKIMLYGQEFASINEGNFKSQITQGNLQHLHDINCNLNFKNVILLGRVYGPLNVDFGCPDLNIKKYQSLEKLLDENPTDSSAIQDALKNEALTVQLNHFAFQIPDGQMIAKGKLQFLFTEKANHSHDMGYSAAFSFSAPKRGLHDLTTLLFYAFREGLMNKKVSSDNISQYQLYTKGLLDTLTHDGVIIDADSEYLCHWLTRNNKIYINGSNKSDGVSRNNLTQFKPPYSPEQQLQFAIWLEDIQTVKDLLKQGVDPSKALPGIKNPLHSAVHIGNLEIAKLLVDAQVPINQIDHMGATPLYWATRAGHVDLSKFLLEQGAFPDIKNSQGWTPLQEAAENGFPEIVELLLSKGANINAQDNDGRTALFWAARNGKQKVIQLLLNNGANTELRNIRGLNAADAAEQHGFPEAAQLLQTWESKL